MELSGKIAVVTGGGRGIGRAVCLRMAELGLEGLVLNYSANEAAARETAQSCEEKGTKTQIVLGDVAVAADCERLFREAVERFGRVDILVNNAGISRDALLVRASESDFDRMVDVNLKGCFLCMKQAARLMMKQRYGRIVNMSSIVGLHGNAGQTGYSAGKAGVIGMTKSVARELASRGITVNAVAPGFIDTDMTRNLPETARAAMCAAIPLGRIGTPADIAETVAFLASDRAAYLTGQVLGVDGGMGI